MTDNPEGLARRRFLRQLAAAGTVALPAAWQAPARAMAASQPRTLAMSHTHTGEQVDLVYAVGPQYLPSALGTLNRFLRDHYSGEVGHIDPQLFDLLHEVRRTLGLKADGGPAYEVISGYRCPKTNSHLKKTRGGGVATRSLHLQGQAIDVRLPGVPLAELRDVALSLKAGGVGYYPRDQFVHLDVGRVRHW